MPTSISASFTSRRSTGASRSLARTITSADQPAPPTGTLSTPPRVSWDRLAWSVRGPSSSARTRSSCRETPPRAAKRFCRAARTSVSTWPPPLRPSGRSLNETTEEALSWLRGRTVWVRRCGSCGSSAFGARTLNSVLKSPSTGRGAPLPSRVTVSTTRPPKMSCASRILLFA